ncbi:HlyU family transcriptional regulator [Terrarubrum flagellatum]|uniref:HlyU family transcriptional regulator n=1 Tax=Terrirubrum flagellatum TaxID=2895980 RepID=UPI003144D75E
MSFLKSLFSKLSGGGAAEEKGDPSSAKVAKEIEHEGFIIRATPYKEAGQFQLCGVIAKEVAGEMKEHRFIRAERFPSLDDAVEMTLSKGRQIVDQNGERVFK